MHFCAGFLEAGLSFEKNTDVRREKTVAVVYVIREKIKSSKGFAGGFFYELARMKDIKAIDLRH